MKVWIKRGVTMCILCLVCIFAMTTKAHAAEANGYTYQVQNGKATITGCTSEIKGVVNIPETLGGYPVVSIGAFAFEGNSVIQEITFPDSLLSVGEGAFQDCNKLHTVHLGNGVQVVGERAFQECDVLANIDFGQNLHTISSWGFAYNHNIKHLDFPASLRYLGEEAFSNSTGLVSVTFREGLVSIGKNCFIFSEKLKSIHLPDSIREIGDGAFYTCEKIQTVILGEDLLSIGNSAFDGCLALTHITIPKNVKSIGKSAFYECKNLKTVDLGNVQAIGHSAFESCSALTEIEIPASVTSLGNYVFAYCPSIVKMTVQPGNSYYHSDGNNIIHTNQKRLVSGCSNSVIPADGSVTSIGGYAFAGCSNLTRIVVPDQVTKIQAYAFYACYGLEFMQLPFIGGESNYDNYIGYIFGGGPSQNDLYVPGRLKEIVITGGTIVGDSAFKNCNWLERIFLPESITTIGYYAFANCKKLDYVVLPGNVQTIKHDGIFDGTPYAMLRISKNQENTVALVKSGDIRHQIGGLITFVDENNEIISRQWYPSNSEIIAPTLPEKPADEHYTYEPVWEPIPDRCIGNQTIQLRYIAHWTGEILPGDLNEDGKINSLDGLLLMRYLNGWNVNIQAALDINADGKVNSLDGLILMRYLNGWNVTLG